MALPTAGQITAAATVADLQGYLEECRDGIAEQRGAVAVQALTLSGTTVTPADGLSSVITVDTGGPATGTLSTIAQTNTHSGQLLRVSMANVSRVITVDHGAGGAGQILTVDSADFVLDALDKWIELERSGTDWIERSRSYGNAPYARQDNLKIAFVPAHNTLCGHDGLTASRASVATISVAARAVVLADSTGHQKRFASLAETINIAATGANGRDVADNAGNEQASTWYHLFAIGKDDGTLDAFASQVGYPGSGTSIYTRLPAGYTWAGYLGAAFNNSGSDLVNFSQAGDEVIIPSTAIVSSGTAASFTSQSCAAVIPNTARVLRGNAYLVATAGTPAGNMQIAADSSGLGEVDLFEAYTSTGNGAGGPFALPLKTAQTIYYTKAGSVVANINGTGWRF